MEYLNALLLVRYFVKYFLYFYFVEMNKLLLKRWAMLDACSLIS